MAGLRMGSAFIRAFRKPYTYDVRRNSYLWLGVFWGLLIPVSAHASDLELLPRSVRLGQIILLVQPALLGVLFGAMGSLRRDLESENERLIASLREMAMTDSLTGLYNRRYIKEALKILLESGRRTRSPIFVILVDLDGFKGVNDDRGHVAGDRVLCEVSLALRGALRQSDILGRHGGDEFILIGSADRLSASRLIERAAEAVRSRAGLGLSAGLATWPEDGDTPDDLVAAADRSLGITKKRSQDSRTLPRVRLPPDDTSAR
jgi:diguanylate cyclase (GGDEF)-like protein